jgi:hypothetical protein
MTRRREFVKSGAALALLTKGVRRCAQPLDRDGALSVPLKRHEDADWRKGV